MANVDFEKYRDLVRKAPSSLGFCDPDDGAVVQIIAEITGRQTNVKTAEGTKPIKGKVTAVLTKSKGVKFVSMDGNIISIDEVKKILPEEYSDSLRSSMDKNIKNRKAKLTKTKPTK